MDIKTNVHDFNEVLNNIIDENFPNTERYIIKGEDFFKDCVLELRENGKTLRYSPYELFEKSPDYEETINEFITDWEKILRQ